MLVQLRFCAVFPRPDPSRSGLQVVRFASWFWSIPLSNMVNWLHAMRGPVPSRCGNGMAMRIEPLVRFLSRPGEWRSSLLDETCRLGRMLPVCSRERTQPSPVPPLQAFVGDAIAHLVRGS